MELTNKEREELVTEYRPKLDSLAWNVYNTIHVCKVDLKDLRQEAYATFLELVQKQKDRTQLYLHYRMAVKSRLRYYMEHNYPVKIPHKKFYREIKNIKLVCYESLPESEYEKDDEDASQSRCDDFIESLTEEQREILRLREEGMHEEAIGECLGHKSADHVCRQMAKIRQACETWFPRMRPHGVK